MFYKRINAVYLNCGTREVEEIKKRWKDAKTAVKRKKESKRKSGLQKTILHHRRGTFGHMDINIRCLRDRCDGNIKMKLNDEHAYALIVDFRVRILCVCLRVAL